MKVDQSKHYNMPLLMGPIYEQAAPPKFHYTQVEVLAFQYMTDAEALAELLPRHYQLGKEPLVTVFFSENNGVSFMAGGGFRTATFMVEARFDGERDHVTGDYILVMFESQAWPPIIGGREDVGVPKLFADISSIKLLPNGHLRCEASFWGHLLFGLDVPPLKGQIGVMRALTARQINARPMLAHKYIPSFEGPPDVDYPTYIKGDSSINKLWMGKRASLRFGIARSEDIGYIKILMDALATLTIIKPVQAVHYLGSYVDRYDLCRRLR